MLRIYFYYVLVISPLLGFWLWFATFSNGPKRPIHTSSPGVIMDVRDSSLALTVPFWQTEITRRFPNAVVILCHGGGFTKDEWVIQDNPDGQYGTTCEHVDKVLDDERAEYPDRTIVLLSCNPCHIVLHGHPNCYYFDSSVWVIPDRFYNPGNDNPFNTMTIDRERGGYVQDPQSIISLRSTIDPDVKGNVFEAICAE